MSCPRKLQPKSNKNMSTDSRCPPLDEALTSIVQMEEQIRAMREHFEKDIHAMRERFEQESASGKKERAEIRALLITAREGMTIIQQQMRDLHLTIRQIKES